MNAFFLFLLIFFAVFLYGVVPMAKTVYSRLFWHKIRKILISAKASSEVDYCEGESESHKTIFGNFDGVGDSEEIFLLNKNISARLNYKNAKIFYLPSNAGKSNLDGDYNLHPLTLEQIKKRRLKSSVSLLSRPQIFSFGLQKKSNQFESNIIVFFEGSKESFYTRALSSSYRTYTLITSFNFAIYAFSSILFFVFSSLFFLSEPFRNPVLARLSLSFALEPIFFFVPPAIFLLYSYRVTERRLRRNLFFGSLNRISNSSSEIIKKIYTKSLILYLLEFFELAFVYIVAFFSSYIPLYFLIK